MPLLEEMRFVLVVFAPFTLCFSFMAALATAMFVPRLPLKPTLVFALGLCFFMSLIALDFFVGGAWAIYAVAFLKAFAVNAMACVLGALPVVLVQAALQRWNRRRTLQD